MIQYIKLITVSFFTLFFLGCSSSNKQPQIPVNYIENQDFDGAQIKSGKKGAIITRIVFENRGHKYNPFDRKQTQFYTEWTKLGSGEVFRISYGKRYGKGWIPEVIREHNMNHQAFMLDPGSYELTKCITYNSHFIFSGNNHTSDCFISDLSFDVNAGKIVYLGDIEFSVDERTIFQGSLDGKFKVKIEDNYSEMISQLGQYYNNISKSLIGY